MSLTIYLYYVLCPFRHSLSSRHRLLSSCLFLSFSLISFSYKKVRDIFLQSYIFNILGYLAPRLNKTIRLYLSSILYLSSLLCYHSFIVSLSLSLSLFFRPHLSASSVFLSLRLSLLLSSTRAIPTYTHVSIPDARFSLPCIALSLSLARLARSFHPSFSSQCPYPHSARCLMCNDNTGPRPRRGVALRTVQ